MGLSNLTQILFLAQTKASKEEEKLHICHIYFKYKNPQGFTYAKLAQNRAANEAIIPS